MIIISFILSCSASNIELNACGQRFLHVTLMRPMLLMIGIAIACRKSIAIMIEVMIAFMMINYNCDQRHGGHKIDTFSLEMKMSVVNQALVAMCGFNAIPIPIVCIQCIQCIHVYYTYTYICIHVYYTTYTYTYTASNRLYILSCPELH